jgi:hypothetical protein
MTDTVNLPLAGKQSKKTVAVVAVAAGAFVVFMYVRTRASASSSTTTAAAIDPSTGYPYGSPQDQAALAGESGTSPDEIDPATGATYGSVADEQALAEESGSSGVISVGTGVVTGTATPASNAAWAQEVEQIVPPLINSPTATSDVAAAVGRFLSGLPLTTAQAQIIQVAEAELGPPPVGQFSIIPEPDSSAPSSGTPTGTTTDVAVPVCIGLSAGQAHNAIVAAGLVPEAPAGQTSNMKVSYTNPSGGTQVPKGSKVTIETSGYVTN